MYYEGKKHSGELPIIGVNTYLNPNPPSEDEINSMELAGHPKKKKISKLRTCASSRKSMSMKQKKPWSV